MSDEAPQVEPEQTPAQRAGITDPEMAAQFNASQGDPAEPPIRRLGEYLDQEIESPPELVVPKMVLRGGVTASVAEAGKGKTSLMLNRALLWAAGKPQFRELPDWAAPVAPLKTLIIENEGAGGEFQKKIAEMLKHNHGRLSKEEVETVRENVFVWGEGGYAGVHLDDAESYELVRRGIEQWRPDVVVMEPFARLWRGNENDNTEMNALLSALEELATKQGCGIIVAHHKRKGQVEPGGSWLEMGRGASALGGAVTYYEAVKPVKDGDARELICDKNRYGPMLGPFRMRWRDDQTGWYDYVSMASGVSEIIDMLDCYAPSTVGELSDELEEDEQRVRRLLNKALDDLLVRRISGEGKGYRWVKNCHNEDTADGGPQL